MRTTRTGSIPPFVGADLTDGGAARPRPVDVCGLSRDGAALVATFWQWRWDGEGFAEIAAELAAARGALLDGPHALAAAGRTMRACERLTAAAGKTPALREALVRGRPFAGFLLSSLDLFAALDAAGLSVSPGVPGPGIWETYPGHLWRQLAPGLARKSTAAGLAARARLLRARGVRLGRAALDPDRLDAAICALAAAAACGAVPGLRTRLVGEPLVRRADGTLEEGPIVVFDVE
jgi:hypothetical protein